MNIFRRQYVGGLSFWNGDVRSHMTWTEHSLRRSAYRPAIRDVEQRRISFETVWNSAWTGQREGETWIGFDRSLSWSTERR